MIGSPDRASWFIYTFFVMVGSVQVALLIAIAKSNKRQVSFHDFLSRPWVDLGRWVIKIEDPCQIDEKPGPHSGPRPEKPSDQTDTLSMGVSFEIFNRAAFPLVVDSIVILMGRSKQGEWHWTEFRDRSSLILRPHWTDDDNSEVCKVTLGLKGDEVVQYAQKGLYLRIYVKIFYFDTKSNRVRQDFGVDALVKVGGPTVFNKSATRKFDKIGDEGSLGPETFLD